MKADHIARNEKKRIKDHINQASHFPWQQRESPPTTGKKKKLSFLDTNGNILNTVQGK